MPMERFITNLEQQRRVVLNTNWSQVAKYLNVPKDSKDNAMRDLVMPGSGPCLSYTLPNRRRRAITSMSANKHEPQARALGSNGVPRGALLEAA
jgi:hypothetical protein